MQYQVVRPGHNRRRYESFATRNCNCLRDWEHRKLWRKIWVFLTTFIVLVVMPILTWALLQEHEQKHIIAWLISGIFVCLTLPIALNGIVLHLHYFTKPHLQRYIIRILLMVPIYSIESFLALRYKDAAIYINTIRECYESYVVYNFVFFLIASIGDEDSVNLIIAGKPQHKHVFPFNIFLRPWNMNHQFLSRCKHGVLSYAVVRPITSLITLILQIADVYKEGVFSFQYGYIYIVFINNISQIWALYCLVLFYLACKEDLAPINPLPKFMSVKAVVFFSWWQSVAIAILFKVPAFRNWAMKGGSNYSELEVATGLQDFLICIEMFVAAIVHHYAFSHEMFALQHEPRPFLHNVVSVFDVSDVKQDVVSHVSHVSHSIIKQVKKAKNKMTRNEQGTTEMVDLPAVRSDDRFTLDDLDDDDDEDQQLLLPRLEPTMAANIKRKMAENENNHESKGD